MTRFAKTALAGLTAMSLALAPIPAAADSEDIGKVLAGLAVLGVIAAAANNRDKKRKAQSPVVQSDPYATIEQNNGRRVIDGTFRGSNNGVRAKRHVSNFAPVPARCERILTTAQGERRVYGQRCLNRHYGYANQLPRQCNLLVRTGNGTRSVYGARCLRRNGWQLAQN